MTKVKICGIHSIKEANECLAAGADYLGLLVDIPATNLSNTITQAKDIVSSVSNGKFIILTIEEDPVRLCEMLNEISPWGVQLLKPNTEVVKILRKNTKVKLIPVIHITSSKSIDKAKKYHSADFLLLDSKAKGMLGGTGKIHNWAVSKKIINQSPIPVFLAGGLNENNVIEAINIVRPFGVDAESSLRNSLGARDLDKVTTFIKLAKYP